MYFVIINFLFSSFFQSFKNLALLLTSLGNNTYSSYVKPEQVRQLKTVASWKIVEGGKFGPQLFFMVENMGLLAMPKRFVDAFLLKGILKKYPSPPPGLKIRFNCWQSNAGTNKTPLYDFVYPPELASILHNNEEVDEEEETVDLGPNAQRWGVDDDDVEAEMGLINTTPINLDSESEHTSESVDKRGGIKRKREQFNHKPMFTKTPKMEDPSPSKTTFGQFF